jgi:hypothetical protein
MRTSYDDGIGGLTGRWLAVYLGPGCGYMRNVWVSRCSGPGNATAPGRDCGHAGLNHCNSIHCRRWICNLPKAPVIGWLLRGHTFRIWLGPAKSSGGLRGWWFNLRTTLAGIRQKAATHPHMNAYKLVSFR